MNIGNNIRYLRLKSKKTQEQLAEQLGVSYQAVSKWEKGANLPDVALLPVIASVFGVMIDTLFVDNIAECDAEPEAIPDDDVIRVIQMRGRRVMKVTSRISSDDPPIEIAFPRNCNDRTQYFKVEVFGHLVTDGSINGDVVAHQTVRCGDINGDLCAQGDVKAHEIHSCGKISCQNISDCYHLSCQTLMCGGEIHATQLKCEKSQ